MIDYTNQRIDTYQLVQRLGQGTFGQVYRAEDLRRHTQVAIKVLLPFGAQHEEEQFYNEVRSLVRLRHPHIVPILDFGIDKTTRVPFLVMEYAPNGSLRQRHGGRQVPLNTVVQYVSQIASALQFAHDDQLIHRDVKPDNILIGANSDLLLADLGISVMSGSGRTSLGQAQGSGGTPLYMAPEQLKGKPSRSSDQYALAIMAYEWLCGTPPFTGNLIEVYGQHLSADPPPLSEKNAAIPEAVEQAILKALAKEAKDRYATIQEFANALEGASRPKSPRPVEESVQSLPTIDVKAAESVTSLPPTIIVKTPPPGTHFLTYTGHTDGVNAVAWSPNGRFVASGSEDNTVQVWDASTAQWLISYTDHMDQVRTVAWSPNGRFVASGSEDNTVQVWDASTAQCHVSYTGHKDNVWAVAWSPDGRRIASGSWDNTVQVWDTGTGQRLISYTGHKDNVWAVAWSPDGLRVASCGDNTVQVWNAGTGQRLGVFNGHTDNMRAVAWSPDGRRVASCGDNTVQVWHVDTGQHPVVSYTGHKDNVWAVAWSPDGRHIASGSGDNTVQVWDAGTRQRLVSYTGHTELVYAVAWSPDGQRVASGSWDNTVQVWQAV